LADDIAQLDESTMKTSSRLTALTEYAIGVELQVKMDKTKYMTVATTQGDVSVQQGDVKLMTSSTWGR